MKKEILCIENGGIEDLHHIFLRIKYGEVTGLAFEKAKEQTSFLKIITGEKVMKEGRIYFHETLLQGAEEQKRIAENTAIITNVSNIVSSISVIENLFLLDGSVKEQILRKKSYYKQGEQVLKELDCPLDLRKKVSELDFCEKITLEILKSYIMKKEIIVISNIWGMLEVKDRDRIWKLLERVKEKGIAFLLMDELYDLDFCHLNSLSLVKKNRTLISKDVTMEDYQKMYKIFYGASLSQKHFNENMSKNCETMKPGNTMECYMMMNALGDYLKIRMYPGDIREVVWVNEKNLSKRLEMFAEHISRDFWVRTGGKTYLNDEAEKWYRDNVSYVMEDPWQSMLFPKMSVLNNIMISVLRKFPNYYVLKRYEKGIVKMLEGVLDKKYFSMKITELEPYMRQKIVYCRLLVLKPKLVICMKPLSEGNIHVREITKEMIEKLAENGTAVLCMTTDVQERTFKNGEEVYIHKNKLISMEETRNLTDKI